MSPSKLNSSGEASVSCSQSENGFLSSHSLLNLEKPVQELIQESPVQGSYDHLIEFSEAMRTVAKALRCAAKGKAFAQAEAAEWKRKYELERMQNLQLEHKEQSLKEHHDERMETLASQSSMQPEYCCGRNGICSLEVLRDGEADSDPNFLPNNKFMRKMAESAEKVRHLGGTMCES